MRMDVEFDVLHLLPRSHSIGCFMYQIRGMQAEDVHTKDLTAVFPAVQMPR